MPSKLQFLLAIVCGTVWAVNAESSSLPTSSSSIGAASSSSSNNVQPASSSSSLPAQSRSDQALKSAINQVLGSAVAAAASSLPSSSASTYYTNDLSQFMAAAGGEQQKLESRQQPAPGSPASAASSAPSSSSSSSSSLAIPYQALLQALANSQSGSSPNGQQASLFPSGSSLNPSIVLSPSSSSSSNGASWALPSSWSSSLGSGSSSGLFQMLRPSQIGGRRSSLTSRLKNFMNSIFYRSESSQPYASASTNSYAYRPAPYGFNPVASGFGGFSSLYGSGSPSGSGSASGPFASLFGSSGSQSAPAYNFPSGSLYGASSNYRPSFIAMPNMFAAGGEAGGWNSPGASSFAGLGPYSDSRKNYASAASNYGNNGNSGESSYGSNYGQDSGRWASSGGANSGPSTSGSNPGAIWSSQYQPQGYGPNSLTSAGSNSERGLSAAAGSSGAGIAANYQEASPSSYYPSYQQRISSLTSTSGASPLASAYAQQAQASSGGISDRMSSAYGSAPSTANKSGY